VEQSRDLTNRNRIGGSPGRTSGRLTAKSISIKGLRLSIRRVRGEGSRAYLGRSAPRLGNGTEGAARHPDRGAEVSRGHSRPCCRRGHL